MNSMFEDCNSLKSLDVSSFNTANVTDMGYMFAYCSSLTELDVSGFDAPNVTGIGCMFLDCDALVKITTNHELLEKTAYQLLYINDKWTNLADGTVYDSEKAMQAIPGKVTLVTENYTAFLKGDVNNDGVVTDADAVYLLYYTFFGEESYPLH